jgi:hypothetical protein
MTSTPSETDATRRGFRFPPRASLPRDVTIPRLPLLGRSWYKRGFLYWARRTGISAVLVLVLVAYLAMIEAVLQAISKPGTGPYWVLVAAEVVFTLVSGVLMFRHLWRLGVSGRSVRGGSSRYGRAGAGTGALAFSAGGVLAGLLVLCSVITAGVVLAAFVMWLVPVPPTEQYARRILSEELQLRHNHPHTPRHH